MVYIGFRVWAPPRAMPVEFIVRVNIIMQDVVAACAQVHRSVLSPAPSYDIRRV